MTATTRSPTAQPVLTTGGAESGGAAVWRRWRAPALLVAVILLGGVVIGLLRAPPPVTGPLDPSDTGPFGAHAVAALLTARGQQMDRTGDPAQAAAAAGPGTTLVVTSPQLLGHGQLMTLERARASLLLVAPARAALAALAPGVTPAGEAAVRGAAPSCTLPGARLAGTADLGGLAVNTAVPGAVRCYPLTATPGGTGGTGTSRAGAFGLVRYLDRGRLVTVLATGVPLTNGDLARDGNAALALNLLATTGRVVWLVPGLPQAAAAGGGRPLSRLIPLPVYLVAAELGVAVLLAALWRMRRFGPLVAEPLPATVRASETVEGHGRLYRARRVRDRTAAALRTATLTRITARLGLPQPVPHDVACQELASRTGRTAAQIRAVLFGRAPADDAALVALAADLDALERQVLAP
jgi:uncharacterized protein DUF4350